jgi:uncharacterized protein YndB with AHSA1/START domain
MTDTRETQIVLDNEVPLVRIIREFDASPAKVFRAHADPDLFTQWNGPAGSKTRVDYFDFRTGGSWRLETVHGDFEANFRGTFHEVRPDELIVQTFTWEGMPDGVALEKIWFEDLGDGRTRLTSTSLVDSFADRDAFVASGMEDGVREGYERLDELVATLDAG